MLNWVREKVRKMTPERWDIGFITTPLQDILKGAQVDVDWMLLHEKDRWYADPFVLDVTEKEIILLVEEYNKHLGKGLISKLIVDKESLKLKNDKRIFELNSHLSFPFIRREGNEVYVYPENSVAGKLVRYRYNPDTEALEDPKIVCEDPITDGVITNSFGKDLLLGTKFPYPNNNELQIYERQSNSGQYQYIDTIEFEENIARNAGDIFEYEGKIYRPAQECNKQYGHAVVLQEINNDNGWHFKDIRKIYSTHPYLREGMHTFNMYKGVMVTDALGFDRMWIRKMLK